MPAGGTAKFGKLPDLPEASARQPDTAASERIVEVHEGHVGLALLIGVLVAVIIIAGIMR